MTYKKRVSVLEAEALRARGFRVDYVYHAHDMSREVVVPDTVTTLFALDFVPVTK